MLWRFYLKTLLLPPAVNLLGLLLAFWLWRRHSRLAMLLAVGSFGSLLALSMPGVALQLQQLQVVHEAIRPAEARAFGAGAIVVLGGGRNLAAAEYGGRDQPGSLSLQRLRYAAYLHGKTGLPLLVTGGRVAGEQQSEAELMRDTLQTSLGTPVRWLEPHSRTTFENAAFSAQILADAGIRRVILVTSATHMQRSVGLFEQRGLQVLPAPTGLWSPPRVDPVAMWLPHAEALLVSSMILHEQLGLLWYRLGARFPALQLPT